MRPSVAGLGKRSRSTSSACGPPGSSKWECCPRDVRPLPRTPRRCSSCPTGLQRRPDRTTARRELGIGHELAGLAIGTDANAGYASRRDCPYTGPRGLGPVCLHGRHGEAFREVMGFQGWVIRRFAEPRRLALRNRRCHFAILRRIHLDRSRDQAHVVERLVLYPSSPSRGRVEGEERAFGDGQTRRDHRSNDPPPAGRVKSLRSVTRLRFWLHCLSARCATKSIQLTRPTIPTARNGPIVSWLDVGNG